MKPKVKEISSEKSASRPPRDDLFRAIRPGVVVRAAEGESSQPTLTGHFAVFNQWAEIDSFWEGRFMERLAPGAFVKTFNENRDSMRVLFNHGKDPSLGNQVIADIAELREDDTGAYYEATLLDGLPPLILSGLRAGQYGASFRFSVVKEELNNKPDRSDLNPEGLPERTIQEVRCAEFGPVTFPAYAGATAGVRSLSDEFHAAQLFGDPAHAAQLIQFISRFAPASAAALSHAGAEPEAHSHGESRNQPQELAPLVVVRNPNRRR